MNQLFSINDEVTSIESKVNWQIVGFLGGGGQGEVYKVKNGESELALKWYFNKAATDNQRNIIERLIETGKPSDSFLWPIEIVESKAKKTGFGYLMPLRKEGYRSISELVMRKFDTSFYTLTTAAFNLVDSFRKLHAKGLCYRDINFDNIFFDLDKGDVLIVDNDNVGVNGASVAGVQGTQRFMAPEVVMNKANPNADTDLYSLAILLFYMFVNHHPLEGKIESEIKCFDLPAMRKLYGSDAIFIFDPDDKNNRPVPGIHDNAIHIWPILPGFLQEKFLQSFTGGITDPQNGRVRESVWKKVLIKLRNSIFYCTDCGAENFYDITKVRDKSKNIGCWNCNSKIKLPFRLKMEDTDEVIMLNFDTKLYPHHINREKEFYFSKIAAEIAKHPKDPKIWGLKNLTDKNWTVTNKEKEIKNISPGKSAVLNPGVKINFGNREAIVGY